MKEKVLYVKLPENAKYRRVEVTEDGRVGIVYLEESTCQTKKENTIAKIKPKVEIPKPKPLVGGSEVYQKDDVPYWYCKIKNGRDEFMHLYMEDLTEQDLLYDSKTGERRTFTTDRQMKFAEDVLEALENKPKAGYCWIPVFEPSYDGEGGLQFVADGKPVIKLNCYQWTEMLKEYSPENESGMTSKTTYFLLLLRCLKDDLATLEQLADLSETIEHYADSIGAERTGKRKFGGLYVGYTFKIVKDSNSWSGYSQLGGYYDKIGKVYPLANVEKVKFASSKIYGGLAWPELKK